MQSSWIRVLLLGLHPQLQCHVPKRSKPEGKEEEDAIKAMVAVLHRVPLLSVLH